MKIAAVWLLAIAVVLGYVWASEDPEETVIPGGVEMGKIGGVLPPVKRGKIVVWPALPPAERKKVVLPARSGERAAPDGKEYFEVLVKQNGEIFVGGKQVTFKQLTMRALVHAERDRDLEHPMPPSNMPAVIHAAKDTRWRNLQWTMQALADPDVRIWRIWLATRDKDGKPVYVKVFLPKDRGLMGSRERRPTITVELKRKKAAKETRVKLLDQEIGAGPTGFKLLEERVGQICRANENLPAELNAWAWVPYEDAVKVIEIFKGAKVSRLTFVGAPPPPKPLLDMVMPAIQEDGIVIWPAAKPEVRKTVVLPTWGGATRKPENKDFVEVLIGKDGATWIGGVEVPMAGLKRLLRMHADNTRDHELATRAVLIRASAEAPWWAVRTVLDTCADKDVRIHRFCFALADAEKKPFILEMFQTIDQPGRPPDTRAKSVVVLRRKKGEKRTRVFLLDQEVGVGEAGLTTLGDRLKQLKKTGDHPVEFQPGDRVPHADVVKAVEKVLAAGIADLSFGVEADRRDPPEEEVIEEGK